MAITKAQKIDILAKVGASLKEAVSVAFVRFNKLSVADTTTMRKTLKGEGVSYFVAKKTLLKRALTEAGYEGTIPELPGEVAIAWSSTDATAPARGIYEHTKKHPGLSLLGGVFEGKLMDQSEMTAIATIPSVQVLRGMFVNVINSPIQRFAIAMSEVAKTKSA
jgi:large subunit ribosomal protein L10